MPIQFGAPSQYAALSEQQQRLLFQIAEMNRRDAAQSNAAMNQALANAGRNLGQLGDAYQTAAIMKYRTKQEEAQADRRDESYRNREAVGLGLRDWDTLEQQSADAGETTAATVERLRTKMFDVQAERQLVMDARRAAFTEATKPYAISPQVQPGIEMLPQLDKDKLNAIMLEDQNLLMHLSSDNPQLRPEQVIEGRARLRQRMEPYLTKATELASRAQTEEQKFGRETLNIPGEGRYARDRSGAWHRIYEPDAATQGAPHEAIPFDYAGEWKAATADIQQLPPQQQPAATEYAKQRILAKARKHNQEIANSRTVMLETGDYAMLNEKGNAVPIKSESAERERKAAEVSAQREQDRADFIAELMMKPAGKKMVEVPSKDGTTDLMPVEVYRSFEEAEQIANKVYPRFAPQAARPQPPAASSQPAAQPAHVQAERDQLQRLLGEIKAAQGKILTPEETAQLAQKRAEAQRLYGLLRGGQ